MGVVFGHDAKAYGKWRNAVNRAKPKRGLTGQALENAVMNIARMFPDNVIRGTARG